MDKSGKHAQRFAEWTDSLTNDVWTVWGLAANEAIGMQGRRLLVGACSYILTQLDLIPDHELAGSIDDAMVVRLACALAAEHASEARVEDTTRLGRLANEEEDVRQFLGDAAFAKLRRYVLDLADKPVRGRTPDQILASDRVRDDVKRELEQSLKKQRRAVIDDAQQAEALETSVRSYLSMKLK
jgi:uncharacterized membrane protein YkvA (DUF1232 family)